MRLMHGDCLDLLATLAPGSIDMILADPPYGTTRCKWDSIIPLEPMWWLLKRVIKPKGAIVMMAGQPFTSALIMSNTKMFKYCRYWDKVLPRNFLNAKKQPLRKIEELVVFYQKQCVYNILKTTEHKRRIAKTKYRTSGDGSATYGAENRDTFYDSTERYPTDYVCFSSADQNGKAHPTQKPVALMEYMIKTYTDPGETVLDFSMGSGTTGVAAVRTGRKFIGIELDEKYFNTARDRINLEIIGAS